MSIVLTNLTPKSGTNDNNNNMNNMATNTINDESNSMTIYR